MHLEVIGKQITVNKYVVLGNSFVGLIRKSVLKTQWEISKRYCEWSIICSIFWVFSFELCVFWICRLLSRATEINCYDDYGLK